MKKLCLQLLVVFGFMGRMFAQDIDYNSIVVPGSSTNLTIEERLVQLAWINNPNNINVRIESEVAHNALLKAKWSWLDNIRIQTNLNEFTLNPSLNPERANFYPRYNFGIYTTLGVFAQTPLDVKQKRIEMGMAENRIKAQKLEVRAEVLKSYNMYLLAKEKLDVQKNIEQDTYANYKLVEQRFRNGEESVQVYNNILERYTNQKLNKIEAETEFKLAKIDLERLIGVKLEDVMVTH